MPLRDKDKNEDNSTSGHNFNDNVVSAISELTETLNELSTSFRKKLGKKAKDFSKHKSKFNEASNKNSRIMESEPLNNSLSKHKQSTSREITPFRKRSRVLGKQTNIFFFILLSFHSIFMNFFSSYRKNSSIQTK